MKLVFTLVFSIGLILSATATPITIELQSGSRIKCELVDWDGENATIKTEFGTLTLSKSQLSESSLQSLAVSSEDAAALKAKINDLRSVIESLRRDNAALREQLTAGGTSATATTPRTNYSGFSPAAGYSSPAAQTGGYWISSTGKRHNSNCRYFQTSKGRPGTPDEGVACKICGG
jgi:hypothetical protein